MKKLADRRKQTHIRAHLIVFSLKMYVQLYFRGNYDKMCCDKQFLSDIGRLNSEQMHHLCVKVFQPSARTRSASSAVKTTPASSCCLLQ